MTDLYRTAQTLDLIRAIGTIDTVKAPFRGRRDKVVKISHFTTPVFNLVFETAEIGRTIRLLDVTKFTLHRKIGEKIPDFSQ